MRASPCRRLASSWFWVLLGSFALLGCGRSDEAPTAAPPRPSASATGAPAGFARVERKAFNRLAAELFLPLFWLRDEGQDGVLSPPELTVLWGMMPTARTEWVEGSAFTARFGEAYEAIAARAGGREPASAGLEPAEARRRAAVRRELAQGAPMAITSDFRRASGEERAIVRHVMAAAATVERIFARQRGWSTLVATPPGDPESRMLLHRNQGPWCEAPETEADLDCHALPGRPKRQSGLYPAELQAEAKFCDRLLARPDGEKLLHQFVVVESRAGGLTAVPYHEAYRAEMGEVSRELRRAAAAIRSPTERALASYLTAAADAFVDGSWEQADEAWAQMNAENSRFYLRIGPDEVYFEPCGRKAAFHVSFARINQGSLVWQRRLDPLKNDMERFVAELAGKPYRAREVTFHLPDFVDVVLNAGDSRTAHGATLGQSLPNWGPVANEGRGRTVAMTNLYTDPDSLEVLATQAASLLCPASYRRFTTDQEPMLMSTVLHEAAHNLGPAHEYEVDGKTDSQIFGGPLASTLEELKAQTAAMALADYLASRGTIGRELAERSHVRDLVWAFGHISRGLYAADGQPRPYSQLAAIQVGFLLAEGAMSWRPGAKAQNGADTGCFDLQLAAFPAALTKLLREVAGVKARGQVARARELVGEYVDVTGEAKARLEVVRERWLRAPKATFVYAIEL